MDTNNVTKEKTSKKNVIIQAISSNKMLFVALSFFFIIIVSSTFFLYSYIKKENSATKLGNKVHQIEPPEETYKVVDELLLESGTELPNPRIYFEDADIDIKEDTSIKYYLDDKEVAESTLSYVKNGIKYSKGVNKYKVVIDDKYETSLNIVDRTSPVFTLKEITITTKGSYEAKSFVNQYSDNSHTSKFTAKFKNDYEAEYNKIGKYSITIEVCDASNNCSTATTNLTIKSESSTTKPPTTPPEKKYVKTVTETIKTKTEHIKYGVKEETYVDVKYDVYSDGSKVEKNRGTPYTKLNQKSFNGTVKTMRSEAASIYDQYATTRNTILTKTNEYRAEKGISALKEDKTLSIMATIRAMELAYTGTFTHTRPGKKAFSTLWKEYDNRDYNSIAENLALNYSSDVDVCKGWRSSQDHYKNIMNSSYTKIGIGRYSFNGNTYWVQLFEG